MKLKVFCHLSEKDNRPQHEINHLTQLFPINQIYTEKGEIHDNSRLYAITAVEFTNNQCTEYLRNHLKPENI